MAIDLINLHDAIYFLINKKEIYNNTGLTSSSFTPENCPLLYQFGDGRAGVPGVESNKPWNVVPSYSDFVKLLGGKPEAKYGTNCLRKDTWSVGIRSWADTFNTPTGINGKPRAESKPLDTMFFKYFNQTKYPWNMYTTMDSTNTDQCLDLYYYGGGSWQFNYQNSNVLTPGVYAINNAAYNSGGTGYYSYARTYITDQTGNQTMVSYAYTNTTTWHTYNTIIFVDSGTCTYQREYTNSRGNAYMYAQGAVYRLIPEDYWLES